MIPLADQRGTGGRRRWLALAGIAIAVATAAVAAIVLGTTDGDESPAKKPAKSVEAPHPATLWRADFETDDFSQWDGVQQFRAGRASVVESPRKDGSHAGRFEVRKGEFIGADANDPQRNRTEAVIGLDSRHHAPKEGDDWWYRWWFYLPSATPLPADGSTDFMLITQWPSTAPPESSRFELHGTLEFRDTKASGDAGPGHVEFLYTDADAREEGEEYMWRKAASSVTRNHWHEIMIHKRWSSKRNGGFIGIWYDGAPQKLTDGSRLMNMRTLQRGYSAYMKQGIYRTDAIGGRGVIFLDGLRIGKTRASVEG
jgi:polysaccharide lyase-like protein